MNDEEIMKKFNEAMSNDDKKEYATQSYKASNNLNLNTPNMSNIDPLNININSAVQGQKDPVAPVDTGFNKIIPSPTNDASVMPQTQVVNNVPSNNEIILPTDNIIQPNTFTESSVNNNISTQIPQQNNVDFTENQGVVNDSYPQPNIIKTSNKKKKTTITITAETKIAIIIVLILLVFVFFMPQIFDFLRKISLNFGR